MILRVLCGLMNFPMKRIAILGSTGSIGRSTLSVVESYPERFQVVAWLRAEMWMLPSSRPSAGSHDSFRLRPSRRGNPSHPA